MKKSILVVISLITISLSFAFCSSIQAQTNKVDKTVKTREAKEITMNVVVSKDQIRDTINALERQGWSYHGMALNKDGTWTVTVKKWVYDNNKTSAIVNSAIVSNSNQPPDGMYHSTVISKKTGKSAVMKYLIKNGKIEKRWVDDVEYNGEHLMPNEYY